MSDIPVPSNTEIRLVGIILDGLITKAAPDAIKASAVAYAPWLAYPIISNLFSWFLSWFAGDVNDSIKRNINVIIIANQNNALQKKYDDLIAQMKTQKDLTDAELAKANAIIDSFINRNRGVRNDNHSV